jgi:plasmid stabilization system protein ParE
MAEINWTAEAERWLRDLYDYIVQDKPTATGKCCFRNLCKNSAFTRFPRDRIYVSQWTRRRYSHFAIRSLSIRVFDKKSRENRYFRRVSRSPRHRSIASVKLHLTTAWLAKWIHQKNTTHPQWDLRTIKLRPFILPFLKQASAISTLSCLIAT